MACFCETVGGGETTEATADDDDVDRKGARRPRGGGRVGLRGRNSLAHAFLFVIHICTGIRLGFEIPKSMSSIFDGSSRVQRKLSGLMHDTGVYDPERVDVLQHCELRALLNIISSPD